MPNSSIRLQELIDDAASLGDVAPALATGGFSNAPALSIANDVMQAIINGGPVGQPYNWKWNRFNVTAFPTISYQQDYFVPGVVNLGWLESAWASNVNQTAIPKQKIPMEVCKDLLVTSEQTGYPAKICWLPNDQLQTGRWGLGPLGPQLQVPPNGFGENFGQEFGGVNSTPGPSTTASGLMNPGPYVLYTNPIGALQMPTNATTAIKDSNGNPWVLTTFGVCGPAEPVWPTNPQYPTPQALGTVATTVQDGTCVWTAVNPKGQGFRLYPTAPGSGAVWLIQPVGQMRAPRFANVDQTLEPIPDDYATHFKQGFIAECYRRNPDGKVRARYQLELQLFREALDRAVRQADREMDDMGFYPGSSVMDSPWGFRPSPANPFGMG